MSESSTDTLTTESMPARRYFANQLARLKRERDQWMSRSRTLAQYILPEYDRWFSDGRENRDNADFDSIIDNTATIASEVLASGLMTGVTNPARRWFERRHSDPQADEETENDKHLRKETTIMLERMGRSNLYKTLPTLYQELGVFGTAVLFCEEDPIDLIRFYNIPPGEYYLATDRRGMMNVFYQEIPMTVAQVVEQFGYDNCSPHVQYQWKKRNYTGIIRVIHAIEPIAGSDIPGVTDKLDASQFEFMSVYMEKKTGDKTRQANGLLRISAFHEFPVMAPRWTAPSKNVYGYGRGHKAIGDILQLQHQQKVKLEGVEKSANPPLKTPSTSDRNDFDARPGKLSMYDASGGPQGTGSLYDVRIDLNAVIEDIRETQQRIKDAFYYDAFQMMQLVEGRSQITAREIEERREEKLMRLGEVLLRLNEELLDPLIIRVYGILKRAGQFPEPPEEFAPEAPDRVEYSNILSQVQRAQGISSTERFVGFCGNYAALTGDTSIFDNLNADAMAIEYARQAGVSSESLNSEKQRREIRARRQQQEQAAQAMAMAESAATTARELSQTPTTGENALTGALSRLRNGS